MDVITGSPAECPAQPVAAVDVQIHDYTNLDPNSLGPFLSSIRNILASTGMSVKVSLCRGNGALPHCLSGISETLVVRILDGYAKTTKNARGETLGESYSTAAGGTLASIYLGSVHQQAHAANVPWLTALSFVAAHEVGHLLLGTRAHTSRGLMKAVWDQTTSSRSVRTISISLLNKLWHWRHATPFQSPHPTRSERAAGDVVPSTLSHGRWLLGPISANSQERASRQLPQDGVAGHVQYRGGLLDGQSAEKSQLDYCAYAVDVRKRSKRLVHRKQFVSARDEKSGNSSRFTWEDRRRASPCCAFAPHPKGCAHDRGRDGEEVSPVLPVDRFLPIGLSTPREPRPSPGPSGPHAHSP